MVLNLDGLDKKRDRQVEGRNKGREIISEIDAWPHSGATGKLWDWCVVIG